MAETETRQTAGSSIDSRTKDALTSEGGLSELAQIRSLLEAVRFSNYVSAVLLGLVIALLIGVIMAVVLSGGTVAETIKDNFGS